LTLKNQRGKENTKPERQKRREPRDQRKEKPKNQRGEEQETTRKEERGSGFHPPGSNKNKQTHISHKKAIVD
jgi:hypothetical protein